MFTEHVDISCSVSRSASCTESTTARILIVAVAHARRRPGYWHEFESAGPLTLQRKAGDKRVTIGSGSEWPQAVGGLTEPLAGCLLFLVWGQGVAASNPVSLTIFTAVCDAGRGTAAPRAGTCSDGRLSIAPNWRRNGESLRTDGTALPIAPLEE